MIPVRFPKVITRHHGDGIRAYPVEDGVAGRLRPAAVFRPLDGDEVTGSAVRPDLERVVYTTPHRVVCLDRSGGLLWESGFAPRSDVRHGHQPGCALSLDGRTVWVYRPGAMAGRADVDQWVVHDAGSGAVLARREVRTAGHGGFHHVHPVDGSVYLDIGEGQDGTVVLRGVAGGDGAVEFTEYPWPDRCLIALAPGGEQFMTVDHEQADVAFHRHPDGEVLLTLPVEAFGYDPDETAVEWSGGYLTPDTAVVTLAGETDDGEDWFRFHLVDVSTGTVGSEPLAVEAAHSYDIHPLGDGSWLTEGPVRWFREPPAAVPPSRPADRRTDGLTG
ncbi:hypothetical protein [Streptomyces sp. NPDC014656]|uniref:hypothetical protein n=1 Tax=Streptomyces sp. NPDC014656 TaxID=3364878 RepID=UPI0036F8121D